VTPMPSPDQHLSPQPADVAAVVAAADWRRWRRTRRTGRLQGHDDAGKTYTARSRSAKIRHSRTATLRRAQTMQRAVWAKGKNEGRKFRP
jgi:hypothetical protein